MIEEEGPMARKEIVAPPPTDVISVAVPLGLKEPTPRDLENGTWYEVDLAFNIRRWDWHAYTARIHELAGQYSESGGTGFGMRDMQFAFDTESEAVAFVEKVRVLFGIPDVEHDDNVYKLPVDATFDNILAYVGWSESTPESREELEME